MLREADRFLGEVERAIQEHEDDPRATLTAGARGVPLQAAEDPFVRTIARRRHRRAAAAGDHPGRPLFGYAIERLSQALLERWPGVRPRDARQLADVAVRLGVSYATSPSGPPDRTAAAAGRVLEPFVRQALSGR